MTLDPLKRPTVSFDWGWCVILFVNCFAISASKWLFQLRRADLITVAWQRQCIGTDEQLKKYRIYSDISGNRYLSEQRIGDPFHECSRESWCARIREAIGQDLSKDSWTHAWLIPYRGTLLIASCAARPSPGTRGHRTLPRKHSLTRLEKTEASMTIIFQRHVSHHSTVWEQNIQQPITTPSF